jgi:hypothetical protein
MSGGEGQLDFLLLLDSADRKICTYIEDTSTRAIVKHSFITHHFNRISFAASKNEALEYPADTFIVNTSEGDKNNFQQVMGLKHLAFENIFQNENLIIFKQNANT